MINRHADRPAYLQVADAIRERIRSGELREGQLLSAEHRLAWDYDVSTSTMRAALRVLRGEGLISTRAPYGTRVRKAPDRRVITVEPRARITRIWVPTPDERRTYGVEHGVPLFELRHPSGLVEVLSAAGVEIHFG